MIAITGLAQLLGSLARLDLPSLQQAALADAAELLANAVRQSLSHASGDEHATPWCQSGALLDSIEIAVGEAQARVGSSSEVAVFQELGTPATPPRPFLGPAAALHGEAIARGIGEHLAGAIRQSLS